MNTKILIVINVITLFILFSCQNKEVNNHLDSQSILNQENSDGTITIKGRITLKGTQHPPLGINTMNIKNKWSYSKDITKSSNTKKKIALGENQRVFVNKDGYYKITIDKNDTLVLIPAPYIYKRPKQITGLTQNQTINIELELLPLNTIQDFEKENPLGHKTFIHQLKDAKPDSLVTVSGTIYKTNSTIPLKNIPIATSFVSNTNGVTTFHLTDDHGLFTIQLPKNSHIVINGMNANYNAFVVKKDTVVNLNM